jgi:FRG domain
MSSGSVKWIPSVVPRSEHHACFAGAKWRPVLDSPQWMIPPRKAFATIRVQAWSQFSDLIETHFLDWSEYAYRGQRCVDWPLLSKFDRELLQSRKILEQADPYAGLDVADRALVEQAIEGKSGRTLPERHVLLQEHLSAFKMAALGRRGAAPKSLSDDEWWALGQHFGMATPLLDWTRSAYVACFFAFEDPRPAASGFRAVWAFSHFAHLEVLINQPENSEKRSEDVRTIELIEMPIDENGRMINQSGLFTRTPDGVDIASFIDEHVDLRGMSPVLNRIEVPDSQRDLFLRHLELMNIHAGTLFPDLSGAAAFANRRLEEKTTRLLVQETPGFLRRMLSDMPSHDGTAATERYLKTLVTPRPKRTRGSKGNRR